MRIKYKAGDNLYTKLQPKKGEKCVQALIKGERGTETYGKAWIPSLHCASKSITRA